VRISKDAILETDSVAYINTLGFIGEKYLEIIPGTPGAETLGAMLKEMFTFLPQLFSRTLYYLALAPSYLGGTIGFAFCSLGPDPLAGPDRKRLAALGEMKYYTPALHTAAFALPAHYLRQMPPQVAKAHPGGEGQA